MTMMVIISSRSVTPRCLSRSARVGLPRLAQLPPGLATDSAGARILAVLFQIAARVRGDGVLGVRARDDTRPRHDPIGQASPLTGTVIVWPLTVIVTRSASVNFLSLFRSNGEYCSCAPVIASISISQLRPP